MVLDAAVTIGAAVSGTAALAILNGGATATEPNRSTGTADACDGVNSVEGANG